MGGGDMSTIGQATLQSDENGLVTLQCDRCKSRFKMDCAFLNDELQGDICCPVCGISEGPNTFYPEEVIEGTKKIAIAEAEQLFANAFKGKNRDYDMQVIQVDCCNKEIGLMPIDIAAGFYCPYCGRIVK